MEEVIAGLGVGLKLTAEEEEESLLPEEAWSGSNTNTNLLLVGRVLTRKEVNVEALERTMSMVWSPVKGIEATRKIGDGRILFTFRHNFDRSKALDGGPWSFDKNLIVLNTIGETENPRYVNLEWAEFNVHVEGIPLGKMNKAMAIHVGDRLGCLKNRDKGDGDIVVVTFKYERLSNFCYFCGLMDHISSNYEK
ncbi:hypothetical protein ACJIZ3_003604 [Penstemon smallii]|uniref:DUF4283 domain-containing protein n=1 Tax=Penstemon smallii TaxID=265156 RepID=A0ABD3U9S8_9LAMI